MTLPQTFRSSQALAFPVATASEIANAVSRMMVSFDGANRVSPEDAKTRLENYAAAFGGTPIEAIRQAARNLLAGRVDGYDGRFAPTPPQWAREARRVHHEMVAAIAPQPKAERPSVDPAERAKIGEAIQALAKKLDAPQPRQGRTLSPEDDLALMADMARESIRVSGALIAKIGGAA